MIAYPRDQRRVPSTPSTRPTRLTSPPRVCRSLLVFIMFGVLLMRRDQQCGGARHVASLRLVVGSRDGVCPGQGAQPEVAQRSSQDTNVAQMFCSLLAYAGCCAVHRMLVCLALAPPMQFGHSSLVGAYAAAENSTRACFVLRVAAVTRSESIAIVCVVVLCRVSPRKDLDLHTHRTRVDFRPR